MSGTEGKTENILAIAMLYKNELGILLLRQINLPIRSFFFKDLLYHFAVVFLSEI